MGQPRHQAPLWGWVNTETNHQPAGGAHVSRAHVQAGLWQSWRHITATSPMERRWPQTELKWAPGAPSGVLQGRQGLLVPISQVQVTALHSFPKATTVKATQQSNSYPSHSSDPTQDMNHPIMRPLVLSNLSYCTQPRLQFKSHSKNSSGSVILWAI